MKLLTLTLLSLGCLFQVQASTVFCSYATSGNLNIDEPYAIYAIKGTFQDGAKVSVAHGISPVNLKGLSSITLNKDGNGDIKFVSIAGQLQKEVEIFSSEVVGSNQNSFQIKNSVMGAEFGTDQINLVEPSIGSSLIWGAYDSCLWFESSRTPLLPILI